MTKTLSIAFVAAAALAGCNKTPIAVNDMAASENTTVKDANIAATMPPAIVASKIYRCKDNSVAYVDWLAGGLTADVRSEEAGTPTRLTAGTAGGTLKAAGYSLNGEPAAKTVTLIRPGKGEQACKS